MNTGFLALVENIYYSCGIRGVVWSDFASNFVKKIHEDNLQALQNKSFFIMDTIEVIRGIPRYPYGYSVADKFRVYFAKNVSDNLPVYVIINAQFLHLHSIYDVMAESIECILNIFNYYDSSLNIKDSMLEYKLSRIDICNHTTKINLDTYIKPNEYFSRVVTKLKKVFPVIEKKGERGQEVSYYRYGSGDLAVRFYNKVREICEQQYKGFFFQKWFNDGLIDEKTLFIYESSYKLFGDYRIDFLYSHLVYYFNKIDELDRIIINSTYRGKNSNSEKYEIFLELINKYNIKLVPEVVNVEFQVRSEFLKTLKLDVLKDDTNEVDYTISNMDIFQLLENSTLLYRHLTTKCFRVVSRNSKAKRLRDATIDKIWQEIQKCEVLNSRNDYILDYEKVNFYREYNKKMEETHTLKDILQKLAHLTYMVSDSINYDNYDNINLIEAFSYAYDRLDCNENLFKFDERLLKQIHLYGKK